MDGENLTGSANEFLSALTDTDDLSPAAEQPTDAIPTAADADLDEDSYEDLSTEERVAAVLGDEDDGIDYPDVGDAGADEDDDPLLSAGRCPRPRRHDPGTTPGAG